MEQERSYKVRTTARVLNGDAAITDPTELNRIADFQFRDYPVPELFDRFLFETFGQGHTTDAAIRGKLKAHSPIVLELRDRLFVTTSVTTSTTLTDAELQRLMYRTAGNWFDGLGDCFAEAFFAEYGFKLIMEDSMTKDLEVVFEDGQSLSFDAPGGAWR